MIYLDHHATTPVLPEVVEAMLPYLTTHCGNPSSAHAFGARARVVGALSHTAAAQSAGKIAAAVRLTLGRSTSGRRWPCAAPGTS